MAFLRKRQPKEARQEQTEFEQVRKNIDRNMSWGVNNNLGQVMDLAATVLEARLESDPKAAISKWREAVKIQDRLTYFEPPAWYYPVRESLGAALLISGDAARAEALFREGLQRTPNDGRMLFGLMESLRAQKKVDEMGWVEREFQRAWKDADLQLRLEDL